MAPGKLIVFEGSDCSFKETNASFLYEKLKSMGIDVRKYRFPNYESPSSTFVKMYLNGELGSLDDINPYVASQFYSADRILTYITEWRDYYLNGGVIILDRYVESNAIHQGAKFKDLEEKDRFLDWLHDLEYQKNGLPRPDIIFFMDMPANVARAIMEQRGNKIGGNMLDIHEKDKDFMEKSYRNAKYIAQKFNWEIIKCTYAPFEEGMDPISVIRSREDIAEEIFEKARKILF